MQKHKKNKTCKKSNKIKNCTFAPAITTWYLILTNRDRWGGPVPPLNHQITNKKWLKSPYHQQKMAKITITKCPLRSPVTKQKSSNHHIFFSAQTKK